MNILDTIVAHKKTEVAERKRLTSVAELEKGRFFSNETLSLKSFLADPARTGIIAEFKRNLPAKGSSMIK
jgi:indole-3-glycerol phosphate synthase